MTGIEPAFSAWEADVLPLNYIRSGRGRAYTLAGGADAVADGGEAEGPQGGQYLVGQGVEGLADLELPPEVLDGVAADGDQLADGGLPAELAGVAGGGLGVVGP